MTYKRMFKKKVFAIAMLIILLFSNYSFAVSWDRASNGNKVVDIANVLDNETYIESDYIATTGLSRGELTGNLITSNGETETTYDTTKKGYWFKDDNKDVFGVKLQYNEGQTEKKYDNDGKGIFKVRYTDAVTYAGQKYDFEVTIKSITIKGNALKTEYPIVYAYMDCENADPSKSGVNPHVHVIGIENTGLQVYVETQNRVLNGNDEITISGVMNLIDIDLNQGIFVEGFNHLQSNVYIRPELNSVIRTDSKHDLRYKEIQGETNQNAGTYFYTMYNGNTGVEQSEDASQKIADNIYILLKDKSKVNLTFTFDDVNAGSSILYTNGVQSYYKVIAKGINGTVQLSNPTETNQQKTEAYNQNIRKNGEEVITSKAQNNNYYLKSVTLQDIRNGGEPINITRDVTKNSNGEYEYRLSEIQTNYKIVFTYAEKLKVTFDAKGGTANTPGDLDDQIMEANEKATKPVNPNKSGYNFVRWQKKGTTTDFNFNTPITADTDLEAVWNPIKYKIEYVLNGGTNDSSNPAEYTVEDEPIDFKSPNRQGYDFKGWYEDENFTKPITQIAEGKTGNVKIYAKWEAKQNIPYKVEYYKETTKGKYELVDTTDQTGTTGQNVTATQRSYAGYKENTTIPTRKATGTVAEDGSLVLKLYYDKLDYIVTFEPNGGTEVKKGDLDNQTVRYRENATKPTTPTKTGYDFVRWEKKGTNTEFDFTTPITENTELEAIWTPTKYKINYILNGGTNDEENPNTYIATDEITFKDAQYTGYTFEGWYEDANFTKKITNIKDRTGDITVYAKWSNNTKVQPVADSTVATKDIPKTGISGFTIAMISVVAVGGIFAIRYFKLKNMMK